MENRIKALKRTLKRLRFLFIIWTILTICFFVINSIYMESELSISIYKYKLNIVFGVLHLVVLGVFIKYIWTAFSVDNKTNWNNTLMLFFLGVLGIYFWLPNDKELEKILKKYR